MSPETQRPTGAERREKRDQLGRRDLGFIAFVVVVALLAHVLALRAGYILDDPALLVRNPYVHAPDGWRALATHELFEASGELAFAPYYRPLSGLLYWASYQTLGDSSAAQHALNMGIHAAVAVLLYALLRAHRVSTRGAAALAALFGAHPATVELVGYVGGRQDAAGWLFTLAGLLAAKRVIGGSLRSRAALAAVSLVGVLVAAGFREFFLSIGFAYAALAFADEGAAHMRERLSRAAAALGGSGVAVALNLGVRQTLHIGSFWHVTKMDDDSVAAATGTFVRLMHDTFLPDDLAIDATADRAVLLAVVLAIVGLGTCVAIARAAPDPEARGLVLVGTVACGLITITHVPVVESNGRFSDRYAYGFVLGAVCVLGAASRVVAARVARLDDVASRTRIERWGWAALALPIAVMPFTWSRAGDFASESTLQLAMVRDRPDDPESAIAEGMRLLRAHDYVGAGPLCERYRQRHPQSERADLCLAHAAMATGHPREAADLAARYLEGRPGNEVGRELMVRALVVSGQLARARKTLDAMLIAQPDDEQLRELRSLLDATPPSH